MIAAPHRTRLTSGGHVVTDRLRLADTHWSRLRGLLGTRTLGPGEGLWLRPCNRVHMIGMRYAVDLVFLDDDHRVVRTLLGLGPGRISPRVAEATSVLELPAGTLERLRLVPGSRLEVEGEVRAPRVRSRAASVLCNLALASLYLSFALAHAVFIRRTGQWATAMPLVAQEALLVVLFLTRRPGRATSTRPLDWAVAGDATVLPLLMRPAAVPPVLGRLGGFLQVSGLVLATVATAFLGRSVAVVPGNRGIKTGGAYRVVRHPMYGAYLLSYLGYVTSYPSLRNCLLGSATVLALNVRALLEERFLSRDSSYADYLHRVPWRFVPYLY